MIYLGDIAEDATVSFCWSSNDGSGGSITRATNGTIKVRRHGDGTDCTGTSVTDTEDTPNTGIHECKINTGDNDNYTIGYDYTVWLDGAVIDGETVNASLANFSIENRFTNVQKISGDAPADIGDAVWDEALSGHVTAGTAGKYLGDLGGGVGAITATYTVYEDDGTTPLPGVDVWVTSDIAGSLKVAGVQVSDASGETEWQLDAGTYYFWRQLAAWNFTNPDTETVS